MKLKNKNELPENNTLVFALSNAQSSPGFFSSPKHRHRGFIGVVLFLDGKWYSMPDNEEVSDIDFLWIDMDK